MSALSRAVFHTRAYVFSVAIARELIIKKNIILKYLPTRIRF